MRCLYNYGFILAYNYQSLETFWNVHKKRNYLFNWDRPYGKILNTNDTQKNFTYKMSCGTIMSGLALSLFFFDKIGSDFVSWQIMGFWRLLSFIADVINTV